MYRLAGDMAKALFYEKESELIFKNCDLNIMLLQHLNYDYAAIGRVLGINSDSVRKNIARITPLTK